MIACSPSRYGTLQPLVQYTSRDLPTTSLPVPCNGLHCFPGIIHDQVSGVHLCALFYGSDRYPTVISKDTTLGTPKSVINESGYLCLTSSGIVAAHPSLDYKGTCYGCSQWVEGYHQVNPRSWALQAGVFIYWGREGLAFLRRKVVITAFLPLTSLGVR